MEENDQWTERDVALDRYRRHHEIMAELFSPFSANQIDAPASPYALPPAVIEQLREQLKQGETVLEAAEKQHCTAVEKATAGSAQCRDALSSIRASDTLESLDACRRKLVNDSQLLTDSEEHTAAYLTGKVATVTVQRTPVPPEDRFPHSERLMAL